MTVSFHSSFLFLTMCSIDVSLWSVGEVCDWLKEKGQGLLTERTIQLFKDSAVDGASLLQLSHETESEKIEDKLKSMRISHAVQRQRVITLLASLNPQLQNAEDSVELNTTDLVVVPPSSSSSSSSSTRRRAQKKSPPEEGETSKKSVGEKGNNTQFCRCTHHESSISLLKP